MFSSAKDIWEKKIQLCKSNDQPKENKLHVAIQKFDGIKMNFGDSISVFDERVRNIIIKISALGKEYGDKKVALEVMRALSREWDVKTMVVRESKDLNKLKLHDLFVYLKAYEFELESRTEGESTSKMIKALFSAKIKASISK